MASPHPAPTSTRLNLTAGASASKAARDSIISSSAKGWSPLQINKRDGPTSPLKPSPNPSEDSAVSPRRTSNSFKHVTRNSLVSNSPFKSAMANVTPSEVIHEKRSSRAFGQAPLSAAGVSSTPKAAIGLGIGVGANRPRNGSRTPSGSGSAVSGARKVSNERKAAIPSVLGERKASGERKVSGSRDTDSPRSRSAKSASRSPGGLKGLKDGSLVSKSPFLQTKRIPSGGSPSGPSPKTIPSENTYASANASPDVRKSSPSPRRLSGGRHVSPGKSVTSLRISESTPSPPRLSASQIPAAGPSPLSISLAADPAPTPSKSAMTPSRRLRGPRDLTDMPNDSPSKSCKTVTFQSVPDVKEFERMSVEGSMDGSFEVEDGDWVDDHGKESDLDDILEVSGAAESLDDPLDAAIRRLRLDEREDSPETIEDHGNPGDESTTADFVNTLIEEGLFSPPELPTPVVHSALEIPEPSVAPQLDTPSLGGSMLGTPMFGGDHLDHAIPAEDEAGIPYGRTHHAERAVIARASSFSRGTPPTSSLPRNDDHKMLLNANAAQPSLGTVPSVGPHAHQDGPMHDPFITIQTATNVISPPRERSEGGIPLGRTSHMERIQAARTLATQQLGLGLPRGPTSPARPTSFRDDDEASESGSEGESREVMFDASFEDSAPASAPPPRGSSMAAGPPKVQSVDLPEPVSTPQRPVEDVASKRVSPRVDDEAGAERQMSKLGGFGGLPFISAVSPFFSHTAAVPDQDRVPSDSSAPSSEEDNRPLTPPPSLRPKDKDESPHRIPSFEFEEISLVGGSDTLFRKATVTKNPTSPIKASTEFGPARTEPIAESTTTKVRQRISREMIRETINARIADGSISRRPNSVYGSGTMSASTSGASDTSKSVTSPTKYTTSVAEPRLSVMSTSSAGSHRSTLSTSSINQAILPPRIAPVGANKALPAAPQLPSAPQKSHTADPIAARLPAAPQRSMTQAAQDVIQQNSNNGLMQEPRSALDRIAQSSGMPSTPPRGSSVAAMGPTASPFRPVSILLKPGTSPAQAKPVPPSPNRASVHLSNSHANYPSIDQTLRPAAEIKEDRQNVAPGSPTSVASQQREDEINARRKHKESRPPSFGSTSDLSAAGRKSRRSMSMSDVIEEEPRRKPRLTLGLGEDQESITQTFQDETANIGSDRPYKVRERPEVQASLLRTTRAGDLEPGRAWRAIRRPSDINEHAAKLRQIRNQESFAGKASGTIFVKVLGIESLHIPLPEQDTYFCITLDNGIDYMRTPYSKLVEGARVNQEFSLIEHANFEFSLSLDIRRDPHILRAVADANGSQIMPMVNPRQPSSASTLLPPGSPVKSGIRSLFGSPRKPKSSARPDSVSVRGVAPSAGSSTTTLSHPSPETIARYLATPSSSTIAKTHVAFKPIAKSCEARVLEIRYPMFAMFKGEPDRPGASGEPVMVPNQARKQVAKITLQVFRLPPLPGLSADEMPQCIDECVRGIKRHAWHECEYHEGILTQEGGDCSHPRRRMFKLVGGSMVAHNEVTRKEVTAINLRQATSVIDLDGAAGSRVKTDEEEGWVPRPHSFRVMFSTGEGIVFAADKEGDKTMWMDSLQKLVGQIPSNPLWAEVLASQRRLHPSPEQPRSTPSKSRKSSLAARERRASGGTVKARKPSLASQQQRAKSALAASATGSSTSSAQSGASMASNGGGGGRKPSQGGSAAQGRRMHREV